jgi:hypothetical protein
VRSTGLAKRTAQRALRRASTWIGGADTNTPPVASRAQPDPVNVSAVYAWLRANGSEIRPQYLWGMLHAARATASAGLAGFSALEFGVAGGHGLLELEAAASAAEEIYPVTVEIVGFDSGSGMPAPTDHRDVPWVIKPGVLAMDESKLRARLTRADLALGPVVDTVPRWLTGTHPPVGFISFDLDYYSSTVDAFQVLDAADDALLPRVMCYFDDLFGYGWSDFNGERAAITDFNLAHVDRKIGKIHGLKYELPHRDGQRPWAEQMYLAHILSHTRYNDLEDVLPPGLLDAHHLD